MKRLSIIFGLILIFSMLLTACGGGGEADGANEPDETVPAEYAGKTNPHAGDAAAASAGQVIYAANCASCHGDTGAGDGPAGTALDPKPAELRNLPDGPDFIYWRIAEGGAMEPFNSSMPAWKGVLSEDETWQVVTYIQTLK